MLTKSPARIAISFFCILIGIFSMLTIRMPSDTGLIGQTFYSYFLIPVLGHGAFLFSYFLFTCAVTVIFSDKLQLRISGILLILFPVAIWIDNAYITELFPAKNLINRFVDATFKVLIGQAGVRLLEILSLAGGCFLLVYKSGIDLSKFKPKKKKPPRKKPKPVVEDPEEEEEELEEEELDLKPAKAVKEKTIAVKQEEPKASESIDLNLKPYRKRFKKPEITDFEKQPADSVSYGEKKDKIKDVFASLGVSVKMGSVIGGPSVEQYEITPGKGVKLSQIKKLEDDLSLALKSKVLITFNTQGALCIEAPMAKRRTVFFRRLLETAEDKEAKLPVVLGVNASYETFSFDLAELPHMLIAGTTGSGKSILVKTLLASIMYNLTPNDVRLVLVDPKRVDFGIFNASPFMAHKVITDIEVASVALRTLVGEMEKRYDILEKDNTSNIAFYNKSVRADKKMPYIIAVIDEFADLVMADKSDIGDNIIRIAQKARACGIHLILATQRPSAEVISGLIKANVPGKIALSVSSAINSKIIIDRTGAEKLLGKGDMIYISPEIKDGIRLQGAYISDEEIMKFMN